VFKRIPLANIRTQQPAVDALYTPSSHKMPYKSNMGLPTNRFYIRDCLHGHLGNSFQDRLIELHLSNNFSKTKAWFVTISAARA
jgi:hypothetical protein